MPVDHYENFPVASFLLPARLRPAVEAIYRWARHADDLADEGDATIPERLAALAAMTADLDALAAGRAPASRLAADLAGPIAQYGLPIRLFRDLLSAFSQDVVTTRYADFASVRDYCRRSADPVGRLMLHLYGAVTPRNLERSDAICTGLQLANFWQDVAIDWRKNGGEARIYLPADDMARFGVTPAQIGEGRCDDAFRSLMRHEVSRTRALLESGAPLAADLPGRIGIELRFVVLGGLAILDAIEAAGCDVFRARPTLGRADWFRLLTRALRYRTLFPAR
ncbi:squalene synthase HpnC [Derxia gummosa]|uniref:Squalene synthase HpnC n=1 Tax=Derxia gummosa DSM 723 TaxID=1121388 RepID=A0A8B6X3J0_9BURK|nr:squalene synthase HpnC [Derxia gummosa]